MNKNCDVINQQIVLFNCIDLQTNHYSISPPKWLPIMMYIHYKNISVRSSDFPINQGICYSSSISRQQSWFHVFIRPGASNSCFSKFLKNVWCSLFSGSARAEHRAAKNVQTLNRTPGDRHSLYICHLNRAVKNRHNC